VPACITKCVTPHPFIASFPRESIGFLAGRKMDPRLAVPRNFVLRARFRGDDVSFFGILSK
jgi:hypothetical protein